MTKRQLISAAREFREGIIDGKPPDNFCFMVCAPLQGWLAFVGVETHLRTGWFKFPKYEMNHIWLEREDGTIIDPTADQLKTHGLPKMPAVYVGPKPDWYPPHETK